MQAATQIACRCLFIQQTNKEKEFIYDENTLATAQ